MGQTAPVETLEHCRVSPVSDIMGDIGVDDCANPVQYHPGEQSPVGEVKPSASQKCPDGQAWQAAAFLAPVML